MKNSILSNKLSRDEMKAIFGGNTPLDCGQKCQETAASQCAPFNNIPGDLGHSGYNNCYYSVLESCVLGCVGLPGF